MQQTIKQIPKGHCALPAEIKEELIEVTLEEIASLRASKKSFFVIKIEEKLYVLLDKKGRTAAERYAVRYCCGRHMCGRCANFCDTKGELCSKVAAEDKKVEDFPFITMAVESVGLKDDCFVVANCTRFKLMRGITDENWGISRRRIPTIVPRVPDTKKTDTEVDSE